MGRGEGCELAVGKDWPLHSLIETKTYVIISVCFSYIFVKRHSLIVIDISHAIHNHKVLYMHQQRIWSPCHAAWMVWIYCNTSHTRLSSGKSISWTLYWYHTVPAYLWLNATVCRYIVFSNCLSLLSYSLHGHLVVDH